MAVRQPAVIEKSITTGGQLLLTFTSPVPAATELLGRGVGITPDGNLLVGCPQDQVGGVPIGSAYEFNRSTGSLIFTINNPSPGAGDGFGAFVWSTPTKIIVGAHLDSDNGTSAGAAYVFSSTGALLHTLQKPSPAPFDWFGWSVNAIGENVLVGCRQDDVGATDSGSCYMYDSNTGNLIRRFARPTPVAADNFGLSVAGVGTDRVIIGCPGYDDTGTTDAGAAFVFDLSGNLIYTLTDPHKAVNGYMGFLVRGIGNDFLVGTNGSGYAYLFSGSTGNLIREFPNPEPTPASIFYGVSLGYTNTEIMVGTPQTDVPGANGAVYVFDRTTGTLKFKMVSPTNNKNFGVTMSGFSDGTVLVGENFSTVSGFGSAGRAYLMRVSTPTAADPFWLQAQ